MIRSLIPASLLLFLATCQGGQAIERTYQPVDRKLTTICLEENQTVIVKGVFLGLIRALDTNGIKPRAFQAIPPDDCTLILRYVAYNSHDRELYLGRFEATVFDGETQIGSMTYNVRGFAKDEEKFLPPEAILTPMVRKLFPKA